MVPACVLSSIGAYARIPWVSCARGCAPMSVVTKDVVAKYLQGYAEPESTLGRRLDRPTDHILVIPAQDESSSFMDGIQPALSAVSARGGRALCIVVVNATDAHDPGVHARNEALVETLKGYSHAVPLHGPDETPCWYAEVEGFDLVVLDRNSKGHCLPSREGVGLARKIGCDVALAAIRSGSSRAQLIHMSDCDVRLPSDYFGVTIPASSAAVVYRFFHEPCGEPAVDEAHARYEAYLRYYLLGLRHAGSAYGFHTIGSCIAMEPVAYAAVRGVPKREAGEDFYLLNKLAKVGRIHTAVSAPIAIRARTSLRVPFGTGRATYEIAKDTEAYRIYDPRVFELLKVWLDAFVVFDDASPGGAYETVYRLVASAVEPHDRDRLRNASFSVDAPKALREAAAHNAESAVRRKWRHDWFDAFRTLKFVHALRDAGLVDVPWRQAIADASFCRSSNTGGGQSKVNDMESFELCRRLATLEG